MKRIVGVVPFANGFAPSIIVTAQLWLFSNIFLILLETKTPHPPPHAGHLANYSSALTKHISEG